jgi:hypothetical protein
VKGPLGAKFRQRSTLFFFSLSKAQTCLLRYKPQSSLCDKESNVLLCLASLRTGEVEGEADSGSRTFAKAFYGKGFEQRRELPERVT